MSQDLIIARCLLVATEGRYMTAKRRHRASKDLRREWVKAKAWVAALEGQG